MNSLGTTRGADATFVTGGAQSVATGPVSLTTLSLFSARVNGTVNPHGLATTWWFEYGRTRAYGFRTPEVAATGTADRAVSARLTGLTPGVRWHYRLVARSSVATTAGLQRVLRNPAPPARPARPTGSLHDRRHPGA